MATTEKITNLEAYNKYVKKYKSNIQAARQFMADEGVRGMEAVEKQWTNRFLSLQTNWAKMNREKSRRSAASMVAFQSFHKAVFYEAETTASDLTSAEECRHQLMSSECGTDCSLEGRIEEVKTLVLSPLDQLSPRQRSRRTQELMSLLQEEEEENSITTSQLLGYLLHRENYVKDRALAARGMQVFSNKPVGKELSLDEGLYFLSQYKLGRTSYTSLRHDLKPRVELSAHYKLMKHKNAIMPTIAQLSEVLGVILSLTKSVVVHFERLVKLLQLQPGSYIMKAKEGLDGSGRHSVYNQQGSFESHNMIIWMWVPLQLAKDSSYVAMIDELTCSTSSTGSSEIVWKEDAPARPILLAVGKEDKDLLNKLIPPVDAEICRTQSKGVKVVVSDQEYSLGRVF